jgi:hypothetical protein
MFFDFSWDAEIKLLPLDHLQPFSQAEKEVHFPSPDLLLFLSFSLLLVIKLLYCRKQKEGGQKLHSEG